MKVGRADEVREPEVEAPALQRELEELAEIAAAQERAIAAFQAELTAALAEKQAVESRLRATEEQYRTRNADLARYQVELEEANDRLRNLAVTDALTGLRNRRAFDERVTFEFSMARRKHRDLAVVLLDADDFKKINDRMGHAAGDAVLQQLARVLEKTVRVTDLAVRFGGEEFAVILPESDERSALLWCIRMQKALTRTPWEYVPVTVSLGAAGMTAECEDENELLARADRALYRAKRLGKNCFVAASEMEVEVEVERAG